MNTASLELCKELYELSGWEAIAWHYRILTEDRWQFSLQNFNTINMSKKSPAFEKVPAYDLGYLLRKLPARIELSPGEFQYVAVEKDQTGYIARYWHIDYPWADIERRADTPEDALCKLAIELLKQGILTRDGDAA